MYSSYIVNGDDYQNGLKVGEIFKRPINEKIKEFVELIKEDYYSNLIDKTIFNIEKYFPLCLKEIYGRADGANVNRRAMVLFYNPEIYNKLDACTTAIYKKDKHVLFSHNEDDYYCNHENRCLIKQINGDKWNVCLADYSKLNGSSFGFNNYGLIHSCNYLFHDKVNLNNISRYIIARDLLESRNIKEVFDKLNKYKPASPFSYNILDIKTLEVYNIENDFDKLYITKINDKFARSNHFINKENPIKSLNSHYRNLYANNRIELLKNDAKIDDLRNVLAYEDKEYVKSIFMDPLKYGNLDNSLTIANFSIDTKDLIVKIFDGFDHSEISFKYHDFIDNKI